MTTDSTNAMTLEQAISSVQVRNEMRGKSGEYPNGEGWGHCWREDGYWIPKDAWKVIDAHLAPREVTTEYVSVPRDEFEKWIQTTQGWKTCKLRGKPFSLRKHMNGEYADFRVNDRWHAYKAAWNTRATPSDEVDAGVLKHDEREEQFAHFYHQHCGRGGLVLESVAYALDKIKPAAPRVVTDSDVDIAIDAAHRADTYPGFVGYRKVAMRAALESFTTSLPAAMVPDGEVRLWDTQWMTIVNHDNSYRDWSKDDAIAHAVKMTEQAIARNVADGKLPPTKIDAAPQAREMG